MSPKCYKTLNGKINLSEFNFKDIIHTLACKERNVSEIENVSIFFSRIIYKMRIQIETIACLLPLKKMLTFSHHFFII